MTEFLKLPLKDQTEILLYAEAQLNRSAQVLQKDVWVVWALGHLFAIKTGVKMAFKGGTSLSKVYGVIDRFSEDVDVTLDYRDLDSTINPFGKDMSKTRLKEKITPRLNELAKQHVCDVIVPNMRVSFAEATDGHGKLAVEGDGQEVFLHYPSGLDQGTGYLEDWIKLEFGGRNAINPRSLKKIGSDLAKVVFQTPLEFPEAKVEVLSAERTFWEKATLIHVECHRPEENFDPNRKSRHWHDLYKLLMHETGKKALEDWKLLADVIKFKKAFFLTGYANYEACLNGGFALVPKQEALDLLRNDYQAMMDSGMFESAPPTFNEIVNALRETEKKINQSR